MYQDGNYISIWAPSISWPIQSDHLSIADRMILPLGREHFHGKTKYIPGKQVLVRSVDFFFDVFIVLGGV